MKQIIFTAILFLVFSFSAFAQNENSLCPKIEVVGGGVVQPGDSMNFSVKIGDETKTDKLEYEWKVSLGIIASGQGATSITVDTTGLSGQNIEAEIKVKGFSINCANTASEIGSVAPEMIGEPLDHFGKQSNDEVKARMDALFVSLGNYTNAQGYIINYGTEREVAIREKQIRKAINFRKYDRSRVTIVRRGVNPNGAGVWTVVWVVPPGADNPQP